MAVKKYTNSDGSFTIEVDQELCDAQEDCINVCPTSVYDLVEGKAVPVRIDECIECCQCVDACPRKAIVHSSC